MTASEDQRPQRRPLFSAGTVENRGSRAADAPDAAGQDDRVAHAARSPYYGVSPYAGNAYGYGSPHYGGGAAGGGGDEGDSILGAVTLSRLARVCLQRWVAILSCVILGVLGALIFLKFSPTLYEATSILEMSVRPSRILPTRNAVVENDAVGSIEEVFNTRMARLYSRAMLEQVVSRYQTDFPNSTISEEQIVKTLTGDTKITLQRRSRLVRISVRSTDPGLAANLANAYALTAVTFTQEENKSVSEEAVAWLKTTVEAQRRRLEQADQAILDFKVGNQIDAFEKKKEEIGMTRASVNADIALLESRITMAEEVLRTFQQIQDAPERFGSLPENTPRAAEIAQVYQKLQEQISERNTMLARYTAKHPDVLVKEKEVEVYRNQFADVVKRACDTAQANVELLRSQMEPFKLKYDELVKSYGDIQTKIDAAITRHHQLQRDLEVNESSYKALLDRMEEARLAHDENTCTIKVAETGSVPRTPVLPQPVIIYPAGFALGLLIGILGVLCIDHVEDKITGISDIEVRLRMKALCILPHVAAKNRESLAFITAEDKFSHFSEAFGGLRNLLDSPRYSMHTKVLLVVSTQPGEGKTITSTNLALSYATSGQKTLLVDFDMRKPRQARIFKKHNQDFNSLPHVLEKNTPDLFDSLPSASGFDNLDVVVSRVCSDISPANLMATGVVTKFIDWARSRYDRIIIDSPPFGIVGDAVVLSTIADSVMIMCCPGRTHFGAINHAVCHLTEAGARVIGVLVNDVDFGCRRFFSNGDSHYRYTYGYGVPYANRSEPTERAHATQASR
jgi:capsular exopolysaccharide synthesis family protein